MIAIDTSAVIAILWREQSSSRLLRRLGDADRSAISAGNALELQHVLLGVRSTAKWADVESLFSDWRIEIRPFDARQLAIAREAADRFGRGRHKARLNFGDCFAYALAKSENLPLLCVGNDFAETDIALA